MRVVVVRRTNKNKKVRVVKIRRSAYERRKKMELDRMVEDLNPALYDDAKSHLQMLLAIK